MMVVGHLMGVIFLCLLQTVALGYTFLHGSFYDLFCPFIIYLAVFRPLRESVPVVICAGLIMDSFCGGPAFMYVTAYLWLWIGARGLITWLYAGNPMILLFIVSVGVVFENCVLFLLIALFKPGEIQFALMLKIMFNHFLWAVLTGPSVLLLIRFLYDKWELWSGDLVTAGNRQIL